MCTMQRENERARMRVRVKERERVKEGERVKEREGGSPVGHFWPS